MPKEDGPLPFGMTSDEFAGVVQQERWGPWILDRKLRQLFIEKPYEYAIELRSLTDSANMLDWIFQLESKTWATPETLGYLIKALGEIMQPQWHICSGGVDHKIDVESYLERVIK